MKKTYKWNLMAADLPSNGVTFVALYNDGSGSSIFKREGDIFYSSEGDEYSDENMDDFVLWCEVPDCFKMWKDVNANACEE